MFSFFFIFLFLLFILFFFFFYFIVSGYKDLENAFRTIDAVTVFIGDSLATSSNRAKIVDLQKKTVFPKNYSVSKRNKLLSKEKFTIIYKKKKVIAEIFLFDKLLIVAKLKKGENYSIKNEINLETLEVVDELFPAGEMEKKGYTSVVISYSGDNLNPENKTAQRIFFYTKEISLKSSFSESLRSAMNNCQKDRVFGKPLSDILKRSDTVNGIPFIVKNIVESLMKGGKLATEGLFFFFFFILIFILFLFYFIFLFYFYFIFFIFIYFYLFFLFFIVFFY